MAKRSDNVMRALRSGRQNEKVAEHGPFDTKTVRVACVFIDLLGQLGEPGQSWMPFVQQSPGELIPQLGGETYREQAFIKVPGGGCEPGESLEGAGVRELGEEAGIEIDASMLDSSRSMEFQMASRRVDFDIPVGEHIAHWNTFYLYVSTNLPSVPLAPKDMKEVQRAFLWKLKDVGVLVRPGLYGSVLAPSHRFKLASLFRQKNCLDLLWMAKVQESDIKTIQSLAK